MASSSKEKLINSATTVFAEHGYTHATVADIVKGAGANIAAVNYHFGSKENLFIACLRHAFSKAEEIYPVSGNLPSNAPPLERIAAFARAILARSFDTGPSGDFNKIMCHSVHTPGSPIQRIISEVRELEHHYIDKALIDLLPNAPETTILTAKMNIIGTATIISKYPFMAQQMLPKNPTKKDINHFIETQLQCCLATLTPFIK